VKNMKEEPEEQEVRRRWRPIYRLVVLPTAVAGILAWVYRDADSEPPVGFPIDSADVALDSAAIRAAGRSRALEMSRDRELTMKLTTRRVATMVMPIGDRLPVEHGFRAETGRDETMLVLLPGGARLLLLPESVFEYSGERARRRGAVLSGEAVVEVPEGESWPIVTRSAGFTLRAGRYAIRSWQRERGTAISIERGGVYALGKWVEGTGAFALITFEPQEITQVQDGEGFPILLALEDGR
jgi:hypothetical protein